MTLKDLQNNNQASSINMVEKPVVREPQRDSAMELSIDVRAVALPVFESLPQSWDGSRIGLAQGPSVLGDLREAIYLGGCWLAADCSIRRPLRPLISSDDSSWTLGSVRRPRGQLTRWLATNYSVFVPR